MPEGLNKPPTPLEEHRSPSAKLTPPPEEAPKSTGEYSAQVEETLGFKLPQANVRRLSSSEINLAKLKDLSLEDRLVVFAAEFPVKLRYYEVNPSGIPNQPKRVQFKYTAENIDFMGNTPEMSQNVVQTTRNFEQLNEASSTASRLRETNR